MSSLSFPILAGLSLMFAVCALSLSGCAPARSKDGEFLTSYAGFRQEKKLNDRMIFDGGVSKLSNYDKFYFEEVLVLPPEDVDPEKVTPADIQRVRDLFVESLRNEIIKSNGEIVDAPGPATISLRAKVYDLKPGKPAVFALGYVPYVGIATTATKAVTD